MTLISRSLWNSAVELQGFLVREGFRFCYIGGIVVQRWGEPRTTDDVDLTVSLTFGTEKDAAKRILARYQSRHPKPLEFILQARILLLQDIAGTEIDLSLGGMPFEEAMVDRSTEWKVPGGGTIRTCGPSDLVILKAFANRPRDWEDIRGILVRSQSKLDWTLIDHELGILANLKEEPEILDQLAAIRKSARS